MLPVMPPERPMLARLVRLVRELPTGDLLNEPKWDGFRCRAFRDGISPADGRAAYPRGVRMAP